MFATLNEMFGNRTVIGIGRGDSAVRVINGKPTMTFSGFDATSVGEMFRLGAVEGDLDADATDPDAVVAVAYLCWCRFLAGDQDRHAAYGEGGPVARPPFPARPNLSPAAANGRSTWTK